MKFIDLYLIFLVVSWVANFLSLFTSPTLMLAHPSVFNNSGILIYFLVYVDGIIIIGDSCGRKVYLTPCNTTLLSKILISNLFFGIWCCSPSSRCTSIIMLISSWFTHSYDYDWNLLQRLLPQLPTLHLCCFMAPCFLILRNTKLLLATCSICCSFV